jgi:hypothetical protein
MNQPFQYLDREYMKAEEYDDFLFDPTGFYLHTYLPRVASAFEGIDQAADLPRPALLSPGQRHPPFAPSRRCAPRFERIIRRRGGGDQTACFGHAASTGSTRASTPRAFR